MVINMSIQRNIYKFPHLIITSIKGINVKLCVYLFSGIS